MFLSSWINQADLLSSYTFLYSLFFRLWPFQGGYKKGWRNGAECVRVSRNPGTTTPEKHFYTEFMPCSDQLFAACRKDVTTTI